MVCRACIMQAFRLNDVERHPIFCFDSNKTCGRTHVVQLDCILLVNSLKATLTAIVDGVAEILVVFHNHNNLVFVREICLPRFRLRYKYSPRTLCRLRSSNLLVPTVLLVPIRRSPDTHTPCKEY